jgi:hypothetical protein
VSYGTPSWSDGLAWNNLAASVDIVRPNLNIASPKLRRSAIPATTALPISKPIAFLLGDLVAKQLKPKIEQG